MAVGIRLCRSLSMAQYRTRSYKHRSHHANRPRINRIVSCGMLTSRV